MRNSSAWHQSGAPWILRASGWACVVLSGGWFGCVEAHRVPKHDSGSDRLPSATEFIEELCQKASPCCKSQQRNAGPAACVSALSALLDKYLFDPSRGQECLARLRAAKVGSDGCVTELLTPDCWDLIYFRRHGTLSEGERCFEPPDIHARCRAEDGERAECGFISEHDSVNKVARCLVFTRVVEGERCGATLGEWGFVMVTNFGDRTLSTRSGYCDWRDELTCDPERLACVPEPRRPGAKFGENCSATFPGVPHCEPGWGCVKNKCGEPLEVGSICAGGDGECRSQVCGVYRSYHKCMPSFGGLRMEPLCGEECDPMTFRGQHGRLPSCEP